MSAHARIGLAWLAGASALIHAVVVPEHLREWGLEGIFFAGTAAAQVAWAVAIYRNPSRPVLLVGVAGNVALVSIWLYSRAIGIPIGPNAGEVEAIGALDVVATFGEIASLAMIGLMLAGRTLRAGFAAGVAAVVVAASVMSASTLSAGHPHGQAAADGHLHAEP